MLQLRILLAAACVAVALPAQITKECKFAKYGFTCGPEFDGQDRLEGTPKHHRFKLELDKAPANSLGLLAVGYQDLNLLFPGSLCHLYVVPRHIVGVVTDNTGKFKVEFTVSSPVKLTAYMQVGFNVGGVLHSSNGLKMICAD